MSETVRERIRKGLGEPGMPKREVEAITELAIQQEGMEGRSFGPGAPLRPYDGYSGRPRTRDYTTGYNISTRPRINEQVAFSTLKAVVGTYDIAQMCIWHRIDSVRSLSWSLTAKKGETADVGGAIQFATSVFKKPDREFSFKNWIAKYLYDTLAYDAGTLYRIRNNAGSVIGLRVIDGTTIAPLLDYYGNRPTGNAPAFVQYAQGIPWEWLADDDLIYEPFRPQSDSMYGKAPMESILINANTDLRFQTYFLNRFTEGNVPEGFAGAPEGWQPDQIAEYQETWDDLLYSDDAKKHQLRWVPNGTKFDWSNEQAFSDEFSLFLMRKTAAAYHVTPADLGFTENVNKSSGDTQADVQFRVGDRPLIEHVQEILTQFIQDDLGLPLDFKFSTGREVEDRIATAQAHQIYVDMGAVGVSEVREEVFGLSEPDGRPVPRFINSTRSGPIPLSALFAVAGPIDKDTGAPEIGAPFPHHPFTPVEGVTPMKVPSEPPLAAKEYPNENAAPLALPAGPTQAVTPAPAPVQAGPGVDVNEPEEPVAKGEGEGITVVGETVAPSYDLDDEEAQSSAVAKATEDRTFRRFVRRAVRDGRWRDFQFNHASSRTARERNRLGRSLVRKAEGEISVAGLAVRAADTGRVLMLQRGLDPEDPASGKWEFPGGHLEEGEDPLTGAVREWCEETGCLPPVDGSIVSQWTSANFIYQGIVLEIACEADVAINPTTPFVMNPDDPDGDLIETAAWWDPADLSDNPAVRQELADDLVMVLHALSGPPEPDDILDVAAVEKAQHPFRKIDDPLADHYAPKVAGALKKLVTKAQVTSAVEAFLKTPQAQIVKVEETPAVVEKAVGANHSRLAGPHRQR
jgi:8-oxo-dGTP pyrophosphatase MutT (NUDIX family)